MCHIEVFPVEMKYIIFSKMILILRVEIFLYTNIVDNMKL